MIDGEPEHQKRLLLIELMFHVKPEAGILNLYKISAKLSNSATDPLKIKIDNSAIKLYGQKKSPQLGLRVKLRMQYDFFKVI